MLLDDMFFPPEQTKPLQHPNPKDSNIYRNTTGMQDTTPAGSNIFLFPFSLLICNPYRISCSEAILKLRKINLYLPWQMIDFNLPEQTKTYQHLNSEGSNIYRDTAGKQDTTPLGSHIFLSAFSL